jgi:nucleoside-triphosphatase THEP1
MDLDIHSLPDGITILSGGRGAGKTRACQHLVEQAKQAGWTVNGLLCPAVFEGGVKTGIDMLDLGTGKLYHLARQENRNTGFEVTDHWNFDDTIMEKGNDILSSTGQCGLLIVDELGPLEFTRRQGWVKAFDTLARGEFKRAVVVIRPELMDEARNLWPTAGIVNLDS